MFNPTAPATAKKPSTAKFTGFDPADLRKIIKSASIQFRPLMLLGLNAGIGGSDLAAMTIDMVPKATGEQWIDLPRGKTGTDRRFILWPETVAAIRDYSIWRPRAAKGADCKTLFLTKTGSPWIRVTKQGHKDSIGMTFSRMRVAHALPDGTFYDLRRQFQTIAGETLDFPAVQFVMGHAPSQRDMSARYTLKIDDDRIRKVCGHVRQWLFGGVENDPSQADESASGPLH
jgi:integrase